MSLTKADFSSSLLSAAAASDGATEEDNQRSLVHDFRTRQSNSSKALPDNSALEVEAAEHAVNYHRVRRRVQEDIRKSLLQSPLIRHKLQGPRVFRQKTVEFLSAPSEPRQPANGFTDATTINWLTQKTKEKAKLRQVKGIHDSALREYKEEQSRQLDRYRSMKARHSAQEQNEMERSQMLAKARTEFANRQIAAKQGEELQKYAVERQRKSDLAKQKKNKGFNLHAKPASTRDF